MVEKLPSSSGDVKNRYYRELDSNDKSYVANTAGPALEYYQGGLPKKEWSTVEKFLPQALEWCIERGTLPRLYWEGARNLLAIALEELGAADISHLLLLEQLEQQVQVALHCHRYKDSVYSWKDWFGYWKFWGGIDWLNQVMTRAELFGSGKMRDMFGPRKVFGEAAAKQLRQLRDDVMLAARHIVAQIEAMSAVERPLTPTEQVAVELLKVIAREFEAVSNFEREVEKEKARKKQEREAQRQARKTQKRT